MQWRTNLIAFILFVCIAAGGYWLYANWQSTEQTLNTTAERLVQTQVEASSTERELQEYIDEIEEELEETKEELRDAERTLDEFEDEYRATIDAVKDLNKLAQIDEELLQQYSRVYFLNENYIPERLVKIDDEWIAAGRQEQYFERRAWEFLEDLLKDAERDNIDLRIVSAYRSFDQQAQLKGQYLQTYGTGANTFSADQGYSEHQLGTTIDFSTPALSGQLAGFGSSEAYQWLLDNAYKHGFIISYPEGNSFYTYEPWHWRFVGEDLARDLHDDERSFYEVPQRELNEYLISIFD